MTIKPFVFKINALFESDYISAAHAVQVERLKLLKKLETYNLNSSNGINKIIIALEKLNYLNILSIQDISRQVIPIIITIFDSEYVKNISKQQKKILFDCMETQIKYIKFYNRFRGQGQTLLNSGYFDLDYCDVVNKLAYIISENIKSGTINAKVNYYNLFLDQKYKFINGEIIDQDIELMIGKNYKYLHAILDELIEICLWNPECEDELLTLNILMFSRNENNIVNPLINLYFESSKQHVNLINKIIATKRQSFQGFVFLKNFAKINGKNALNKSILKNKAINFLTYFITTADISKTSLYILLEIITYQDYTLSSKTLKSFKEKIDNLLLDFKLTKFESKFLLLLKATLSKNTTYTLKTELETKYKEPHYTLWSAKWTDLIYEKLNDEHQDINFIKWVIDNTDIPITESFLKIQYEKSLPQHKLLWEMFLGKFNSKIDQYIFEKCGLVSQLESLDYKENYEDSLITLNRVLQKRFLFYDVGVLFESEFYKVNYIFTNESLKFVIGNIASLKSADVSIERLKKIGDLEFEFSKSIDICLKPLIVDIKLRTNDHRFFCKRIELQVFLNKMFIETKDMNQAQFEKFFALCEFKKVTRNIHTDHDSFIIFLSKLKRYNLKMININNDLMYLYSMVSNPKDGKLGILSKVWFTEKGEWQADTVTTNEDTIYSDLFNEILSVS